MLRSLRATFNRHIMTRSLSQARTILRTSLKLERTSLDYKNHSSERISVKSKAELIDKLTQFNIQDYEQCSRINVVINQLRLDLVLTRMILFAQVHDVQSYLICLYKLQSFVDKYSRSPDKLDLSVVKFDEIKDMLTGYRSWGFQFRRHLFNEAIDNFLDMTETNNITGAGSSRVRTELINGCNLKVVKDDISSGQSVLKD